MVLPRFLFRKKLNIVHGDCTVSVQSDRANGDGIRGIKTAECRLHEFLPMVPSIDPKTGEDPNKKNDDENNPTHRQRAFSNTISVEHALRAQQRSFPLVLHASALGQGGLFFLWSISNDSLSRKKHGPDGCGIFKGKAGDLGGVKDSFLHHIHKPTFTSIIP